MKTSVAFALVCAGAAVHAHAADSNANEVVVNATKLKKSIAQLTQSATVITEQEIREKGYTDTTEILRATAGVEFKQAGGPGQFNYPKLRGFSGGNILVVIDGIKVNSAGSGDVGNLIGQIDPNTIERIEILRGPQAALYGANSTAGVIAITTKSGAKPEAGVAVEAGSLDWKKGSVSYRDNHALGNGIAAWSINLSKTDSDGVHRKEYFEDESQQLKVSFSNALGEVGGSYWRTDNEFNYAELLEAYAVTSRDQYYSYQLPDPHSNRATEQSVGNIWLKHNITERLSQKLQYGQMKEDDSSRDLDDGLLGYITAPFNGFDPLFSGGYNRGDAVAVFDSGSPLAAKNRNENRQLNYDVTYQGDTVSGLVGYEKVDQEFRSWGRWGDSPEVDDSVDSLYANGQIQFFDKRLTLAAGVRHDDYDSWGEETTGNAGIAFEVVKGATVFANYGTSFKAPTLSQLYDLTYGTTNLEPESGKTVELGFRQQLLDDRLSWDITTWRTELDDVIIFDYSIPNPRDSFTGFGQYNNGDEQRTRGVELNFAYAIDPALTLSGNYTYTDSHGKKVGGDWQRTVQISRNKANLDLRYQAGDVTLGAHVYYSGPRLRWAADLETESYTRVDVSARYQANRSLAFYGRVENLFDEEVVEEIGYEQPGTYVVAGVEYRFF